MLQIKGDAGRSKPPSDLAPPVFILLPGRQARISGHQINFFSKTTLLAREGDGWDDPASRHGAAAFDKGSAMPVGDSRPICGRPVHDLFSRRLELKVDALPFSCVLCETAILAEGITVLQVPAMKQ